jgi:hypothetical protein
MIALPGLRIRTGFKLCAISLEYYLYLYFVFCTFIFIFIRSCSFSP